MKKFLSLILVLVFCISAFAACGPNKTEQAVENATAYVKNMYKAYLTETETAKDFELVSKVMVGGVSYTVTWTSDNDAVKVVEGSDGKVKIDVNEESATAVQYKLTAVVSAEDGTKGEPLAFKFKVPASNLVTIPAALELPDDTFVTVKGKVTIINTPWDDGYKNISVTIEDADGNQLYLYRLATNVKLGDIITVKGVMATYNNARQVAAGATAEITGHEDVVVTYKPVTIPEAVAADDNTQIEVSGTVVDIGTAWSDQYNNISVTIADDAGNKLYIYRLSTKVELGDKITVQGLMATYNGARQVAQGATAKITGHVEITQEYKEVSLKEAVALDDGALVIVKGTVSEINTPWDDGYGNITVTIVDAEGNELYIYRLSTKVAVGDVVTIKGKVSSYNGAKQIAQGATAEITGQGQVPGGGNQGGEVVVPDGAVKYTFADYEKGEQYAANEVHKLDDTLKVTTNEAHFREEIRLYHSAANQYAPNGRHSTAVFESTKAIKSIIVNVGNNNDTLKVSASVDGVTWVEIQNVTVASAYADYAVALGDAGYKFVKLEPTEKQIRVKSITVEYAA